MLFFSVFSLSIPAPAPSPPRLPPTYCFVFPKQVYLQISESCYFHYSLSKLSPSLLLFGFPELDLGESNDASQVSNTAN